MLFRLSPLTIAAAAIAVLGVSCGGEPQPAPAEEEAPAPKTQAAELIASDAGWGNTEGPATDSAGTLYFTSRGTYKGIVAWTEESGGGEYAAVATEAGPGGLWIDEADNIFLTATLERKILKVDPNKEVTTVAADFEVLPARGQHRPQ